MSFLQSISHHLIAPILGFLILIIFVEVIFSWLIAFNVVNLRNPIMNQIYQIVRTISKPLLEPFRKIIPAIGGLDLSPIAALLLLSWLQSLFRWGGSLWRLLG
jgi:YggT family protein